MTTTMPTRQELESLDEQTLGELSSAWRARAMRGERDAYGVAHALEVETRRRLRESQLQQLPPALPPVPAPWWKFWIKERQG